MEYLDKLYTDIKYQYVRVYVFTRYLMNIHSRIKWHVLPFKTHTYTIKHLILMIEAHGWTQRWHLFSPSETYSMCCVSARIIPYLDLLFRVQTCIPTISYGRM